MRVRGQEPAAGSPRTHGVHHRPMPDEQHSAASARYVENMSNPEITQRDLRSRARAILDAVEHGQSFIVTRDGRHIGELIPLHQRRRFVPRELFSAMSRKAPAGDPDALRADQDAAADWGTSNRYQR